MAKANQARLAKQVKNCKRQIAHLTDEMEKLQAKIDDPSNTDDAELQVELDEAAASLVEQNAKLAKLTGSVVPPVDPVS